MPKPKPIELLTVARLIEHLRHLPKDMPVMLGVWHDCKPFDGEGTDMSCYEAEPLKLSEVNKRGDHVYISRDSYPWPH